MKNIEGAFGDIGDSVDWVNGMLFKTTKKEGYQINGFEDQEEMQAIAEQRGHKIQSVAQATSGEWVYSKEQHNAE